MHFALLHLHWTKTTQNNKTVKIKIIERPGDPTCPYAALQNHLARNSDIPHHLPLFAHFTSSTGISWWGTKDFMSCVNAQWAKVDLPPHDGHAFRIGGATHWLLMGADVNMVKMHGCWSLDSSFLLYWRNIKDILPMYLS
jgi:hypothetical protein